MQSQTTAPTREQILAIINTIEANDYGYIGKHIVEHIRSRFGVTRYRFTRPGGYSKRYKTAEDCATALHDYLTGIHNILRSPKGGHPFTKHREHASSEQY